jgi:hypothetical protein
MPHHPKQSQQQRKNLDSAVTSSPGGYCNPQQSFQNSPGSDSEVGTMRNQTPSNWMPQSVNHMENHKRGYYQAQYHRVPSSPPDAVDSANGQPSGAVSTGTGGSIEGTGKYKKQNKRDPSQEIASVLLMAAAAATSVKEASPSANESEDGSRADVDIVGSQGRRPLKKRKSTDHHVSTMSGDVEASSDDTYHVSPISHSSKSGTTTETNNMSHDTPSTSSAHSFDMMKEDPHSSHTVASIKKDQSQSRPQKSIFQMIPQFPSLVHWILSEPSSKLAVDLSVLQWVSHGQAWRIIRWDAFRREVLPAMFPQLVSNATDTGSIDAFMWQLKAWGFQEIQDGPDIGAFAHTVRARRFS